MAPGSVMFVGVWEILILKCWGSGAHAQLDHVTKRDFSLAIDHASQVSTETIAAIGSTNVLIDRHWR